METRMMKHKKLSEEIQQENDDHKQLINDIVQRCRVIRRIYKDKHPEGDYLIIAISGNTICISNKYWGEDSKYPINEFVKEEEKNEH